MNKRRKIVFITGTRADYGKIKPLMLALDKDPDFEVFVFVCGMHLSKTFGATYQEVQGDNYENIYIKGGELSGTIDESIRHAISKFAHIHFVCTEEARTRLLQMGEEAGRIYVIGSPDIDLMTSGSLPSMEQVRERYAVGFGTYGILMYHPVTTEYSVIGEHVRTVADAVLESGRNYVAIYPNNDLGSEVIMNEFKRFGGNPRFRVIPSMRFEHFLTLLKNADFIIGNSSAGIRESGVYGIPAIDIGTRQSARYTLSTSPHVQHVDEDEAQILEAVANAPKYGKPSMIFGDGRSVDKFLGIVRDPAFWDIRIQKRFVDHEIEV